MPLALLQMTSVCAMLYCVRSHLHLTHHTLTCRTEEPPKELAHSSSPLVKGLEDPLEAVKHSLDHAVAQLPAETTSTEAAPATPAPAVQAGPAAPPKTQSQERAAPLTQATAVRAADADATKQARNVLSLRRYLHVQCLTLVMHDQRHLYVRQFGMSARKQITSCNHTKARLLF